MKPGNVVRAGKKLGTQPLHSDSSDAFDRPANGQSLVSQS